MFKKVKTWGPALALISPTLILLAVFVYGLIAENVRISMTNQHTARPSSDFVGMENYTQLFGDADFQHALKQPARPHRRVHGRHDGLRPALGLAAGTPASARALFRSIYLLPDGGLVRRLRRRVALAAELRPRATDAGGITA